MKLEISAENMSKVTLLCEALPGVFRLHYDLRDPERICWFAEVMPVIHSGIVPSSHGATPDEATTKMLRRAALLVPWSAS